MDSSTGSCETPAGKTSCFLSAPFHLSKMLPSACKPALQETQGWSLPQIHSPPPGSLQNIRWVHRCCVWGTLCLLAAHGQSPELVPNPSLTLEAALEEFSAFHGHQLCMDYGTPQVCLSPRSFTQSFLGVSLGAISFAGMSITHSLLLHRRVLKAPSANKPGGHSCTPRPIPAAGSRGVPPPPDTGRCQ